jgi:hypothetical protein
MKGFATSSPLTKGKKTQLSPVTILPQMRRETKKKGEGENKVGDALERTTVCVITSVRDEKNAVTKSMNMNHSGSGLGMQWWRK